MLQNSANLVPLVITEKNSTIEFRNVSFQYAPGKTIFDNLSFTIPAGKKIAIVGGSGTGWVKILVFIMISAKSEHAKFLWIWPYLIRKMFFPRKSTITRLLYRFYEPDSGEILIGGTNIRDLDLAKLRKSIAIVPQVSGNCSLEILIMVCWDLWSCMMFFMSLRIQCCFTIVFCTIWNTVTLKKLTKKRSKLLRWQTWTSQSDNGPVNTKLR